jgi:hypothetical protein
MTRTALLNNIEHKDLKVITRHAAAFGDSINQVLIFPTEFESIQREYPILLRKDSSGDFQALALLGLDKGENLFLDEQGWHARYVPAVQARGPFLIGFQETAADGEPRREPMIHVDLDHPRISSAEGDPVFLPHGGNSPYLERVVRILGLMHQGVASSRPMFTACAENGLIEPVALEVSLNTRETYTLTDYYTIGEDRLRALSGARLEQLHASGVLRAAYFVAASLGNVSRLIELKNRRRSQG